jgi:hypothetical protein
VIDIRHPLRSIARKSCRTLQKVCRQYKPFHRSHDALSSLHAALRHPPPDHDSVDARVISM